MKMQSAARRRIRYELFLAGVLALVLAAMVLSRIGKQTGTEEAQSMAIPTATPIAPAQGQEETLTLDDGTTVQVWYGASVSTEIDASRLTDPAAKTAADLVNWVEMAWDDQWGYVWGTYGNVLDEAALTFKLEQYGDPVADYEEIIRAQWMGRRTVDCAGLIKSYGWYDPDAGSIVYLYGDMPDVGTEGFYEQATERGTIDTLPETPGLILYREGHVGVYIGGGWAIESISSAGGVVRTRVADRPWTDWFKCANITY